MDNVMLQEEKEKNHGLEVLHGDDVSGAADSTDISDDSADSLSDPWGAIESGIFGDIGDDFGLGNCLDEEDVDSPHESAETLILAALRNLPNTRKGRIGIGSSMVEEFDDVGEQVAYLLIQEKVRNCFIDAASKKEQTEAIDWVFCEGEDKYHRTFNECCSVLRVRPWLIQTRIHFQFYKKGIVFEEEMPINTIDIPEIVRVEASYYGGDNGFMIANMAWMLPGISHQTIATSLAAVRTIDILEEKGILSEHGGCWYATGRNPLLLEKARRSISWSGMWPRNSY
jgi:hypothetical protein